LAFRELIFVAIFNDVGHFFLGLDACIYKTRTKKFSGCASIVIIAISSPFSQSAMAVATTQNIASNKNC
jgi:hypothetical protein